MIQQMYPGQDLLVAGTIGITGVRIVIEQKRERLAERFSDDFIDEAAGGMDIPPVDSTIWAQCGATGWQEAGEGGIFTALWTFSGSHGVGFAVDLHRIPVRQHTIEVCELFDLNPYRLLSGQCMLLASDNGGDMVRRLEAMGIPAIVIGRTEKGVARKIINGEAHGFLERPREDELHKAAVDY